jgi:hypothetical protein
VKAALVTLDGVVAAGVHRRTDGNPVEAAKALVAEILECCPTRSSHRPSGFGARRGATVVRARFPDLGPR